MKKNLLILLLIPILSFSQSTYFQQTVNYNIRVRLNDETNTLSSFEKIEYYNNSPDTLTFLWFHLWPNGYANNKTALAKQILNSTQGSPPPSLFMLEKNRGYIDSLDFRINGKKVKWEYHPEHIDICKIYLNEPLLPKLKLDIQTPFRVKLPSAEFSRLGYSEDSFQVTQWYPKPAVYDQEGWHEMPYLNMGEFYSEYGNFEVEISVPQNYVVAATGKLLTNDEAAFLQKKVRDTESIEEYDRKDDSYPNSDKTYKKVLFKEENIHDFAWFADKRFHVLQGEVELPHSHRKVTTWVYYPNSQAHLWKDALEYVNDAVYYYSLWYGDYPYDNCTAVHAPLSAGGGMEYPTITVIANMGNASGLDNVIAHEVGHNWFYGILGSNERDIPWMDEGINSFSDERYTKTKKSLLKDSTKNKILKVNSRNQITISTGMTLLNRVIARSTLNQGLQLKSPDYSEVNYGLTVYKRTALIFWYLFDYLGKDKFNEIMQEYYETWKFQHPSPADLQHIFEKNTGENFDWAFEHLLKTNERIDYSLEIEGDSLEIENKGDFAAPVKLQFAKKDTTVYRWIKNITDEKSIFIANKDEYQSIRIDDRLVLDVFPRNNVLFPQQRIPSYKKIKFSLIHPIESAEKTYLNFTPILGGNQYDGLMLGFWFNKPFVPIPKLEIHLMPMYGFKSKQIVGTGLLNYHYLLSNSKLEEIVFHTGIKRFSVLDEGDYYQRYKTGANLYFSSGKSGDEETLSIFWTHVENPEALKVFNPMSDYLNINYSYDYFKKINPHSFKINTEVTSSFIKANIEASYKLHYQGKDGLNTHIFLGSYLFKDKNVSRLYDYSLGGGSGMNDYRFDQLYLARYEVKTSNFGSHQFFPSDGSFVLGRRQKSPWLAAINFTLDLPSQIKVPLALFSNFAYGEFANNENFYYESGISLSVLRGALELYLPLLSTQSLQSDERNIFQEFRFVINLNKLEIRELSKMVR